MPPVRSTKWTHAPFRGTFTPRAHTLTCAGTLSPTARTLRTDDWLTSTRATFFDTTSATPLLRSRKGSVHARHGALSRV
jgi:hypothetical protein